MKKPNLFHFRAPSQLKQTFGCDFVTEVKHNDSSCKTSDTTKKRYSGDTASICKPYDASEQLFKDTIKGDNILHPKAIISNEEIISNNSDVNSTGLEEDSGHTLHDVTTCPVYDTECTTKNIPEPNNANIKRAIMVNKLKIVSKANQDERTRLNELREISKTVNVTENNKLICSSQTKLYI